MDTQYIGNKVGSRQAGINTDEIRCKATSDIKIVCVRRTCAQYVLNSILCSTYTLYFFSSCHDYISISIKWCFCFYPNENPLCIAIIISIVNSTSWSAWMEFYCVHSNGCFYRQYQLFVLHIRWILSFK